MSVRRMGGDRPAPVATIRRMSNGSIFQDVELLQAGQVRGWLGRLLRDTPAASHWRTTIDRWLQDDLKPVRSEYRQRLLSENNGHAAYNELLLFEVLRRLFGEAVREPAGLPVPGKPDLAAPIAGQTVVIEVATLAEQLPEGAHRRQEIIDRMKAVKAPWVLMPDWRSSPGVFEARLATIEAKVRDYLHSAPRERHRVELDLGEGRRLRFTAIPGHRQDGPVGVLDFKTIGNPGVDQVQREVKDKSGKYSGLKEAQIPFVVAFFSQSHLVDEESLFDALYGQQTINVWVDEEHELQKVEAGGLAPGGKLMPKGAGPAFHTTVSAVWFVQELPWLDGKPLVRLVELPNPWARNPIEWEDQRVSKVRFEKTEVAVEFYPPESQSAFVLDD